MTGINLVDSNILIYFFDEDYPEKKRVTEQIINECYEGRKILAVTTQNLAEFFVNVTKKINHPIPQSLAKKAIEEIIKSKGFLKLTVGLSTVIFAAEIAEKYNISYWDAQIIAAMKENGISTILTENTKDFNVPGIVVINPFK